MERALCAFEFNCTPLIGSEVLRMNEFVLRLVMAGLITLLSSTSVPAQTTPYKAAAELPAAKASRVHITEGPALELAKSNSAIIRWTSTNPGGTDEHFGVVSYGMDPRHLNEVAKSHIRLNRNHSYTVFRVRVDGLQPGTTYYYKVDSMQADGRSDGVKSPVMQFSTH
jgi:phosphodiesterase/alkaline phosphatase D-like protein